MIHSFNLTFFSPFISQYLIFNKWFLSGQPDINPSKLFFFAADGAAKYAGVFDYGNFFLGSLKFAAKARSLTHRVGQWPYSKI